MRSKYNARKVQYDGYTFDSLRECARYKELVLLQHADEIKNLALQVPFDAIINGKKCFRYKADFVYRRKDSDVDTVEDCKGFPTPVYRIKKKVIEAMYDIRILET
jgi:hypothetical protein